MPRRVNPLELGADLALNLFEQRYEDMGSVGWGSNTALQVFVDSARNDVKNLLAQNRTLLPFIETGLKGLLFAAVPNMGPETKIIVNNVIDIFTDKVRKAVNEPNDDKAEAMLATASGVLQNDFRKVLDEAKKKVTAKPPFQSLVMKLSENERKLLTRSVSKFDENRLRQWMEYKERIASVEELRAILSQPTVEAAFDFLQLMYGRKPSLLETLTAASRGEETPQTLAVQARVNQTRATLRRIGAESRSRVQAMRSRYRR